MEGSSIPRNLTVKQLQEYLDFAAKLGSDNSTRIQSYNMYTQILMSYPDNITAALAVSNDLTRRRRFARAHDVISRAVSRNPKSAELWRERSRAALRSTPPHLPSGMQRARVTGVYGGSNTIDDALLSIQRAIKLEPKNSSNYKIQADIFTKMGSEFNPRTIKALQKAVKLDPKDPYIWDKLADLEEDHKKAIILLKKALKKIPDRLRTTRDGLTGKEDILHSLGLRYHALGKFYDEINVMKKYERYRENGHGLGHIGDAYAALGKTKQAIEAYNNGLKKDPKAIDIFVSKIELLNNVGRSEDALKECEQFQIDNRYHGAPNSVDKFDFAKAQTLHALKNMKRL